MNNPYPGEARLKHLSLVFILLVLPSTDHASTSGPCGDALNRVTLEQSKQVTTFLLNNADPAENLKATSKDVFARSASSVLHRVSPPSDHARIDEALKDVGMRMSDYTNSRRGEAASSVRVGKVWSLLIATIVPDLRPADPFLPEVFATLQGAIDAKPFPAALQRKAAEAETVPIEPKVGARMAQVLAGRAALSSLNFKSAILKAGQDGITPENRDAVHQALDDIKFLQTDATSVVRGGDRSLDRLRRGWIILSELLGVPTGRVITMAQVNHVNLLLEQAQAKTKDAFKSFNSKR